MTIRVFDFFSGCGGTTLGLKKAGMVPMFALDLNRDATHTFERNFPGVLIKTMDIRDYPVEALDEIIASIREDHTPILFSGCAPCQPFTKQKTTRKNNDPRSTLLDHFRAFIARHRPDYIFIENVPGLQKIGKDGPLGRLLDWFKGQKYCYTSDILASQDYGVPQQRHRFVLIASKLGHITLPSGSHGPERAYPYMTVRDAIGHFPPLAAGEEHPEILSHRAARLSGINLERICATPPEKTRQSWPERLRLNCHLNGHTGHGDVYGRLRWDEPATGLTTRCISLSNGRFGHPEQHRAISVREAAALQTFPEDFYIEGVMTSQAKQIGNAVPPRLAEAIGAHILEHYRSHSGLNSRRN